jgi:TonB-dependent SusC/RagA subfamily outer membrane receptor
LKNPASAYKADMRLIKCLFLLTILIAYGLTAAGQTPTPYKIICYGSPLPTSPLCLVVFKKESFAIKSSHIDSLIDPKTIKTTTILKDASATSIYGMRGAIGVIIITIKAMDRKREYKRLKPYQEKL